MANVLYTLNRKRFSLSPQSLLSVHDSVAQKSYDPELPPLPDNICDEEEDSVKIVRMVKKEEPLVTILTVQYFTHSSHR